MPKIPNGLWPPPSFSEKVRKKTIYRFKICNINSWIENAPPLEVFRKFVRFGSKTCPSVMRENGICNMFKTRPYLRRRGETEKEEEENNWRRKIFRQQKRRRSNIDKIVEPLSWRASYVNLFLQRSYLCDKSRV